MILCLPIWPQPFINKRFPVWTFVKHSIEFRDQSSRSAAVMSFLHSLYLESGSLYMVQRSVKSGMQSDANKRLSSNRQSSQRRIVPSAYRPIGTRPNGTVPTVYIGFKGHASRECNQTQISDCRLIGSRLNGVSSHRHLSKRHRPNGTRPKGCRLNGM